MRFINKPKTLLTRLVLCFTFIIFVPLILIVLISYYNTSKQMNNVAYDLLLNIVNNVDRNLENTIDDYDWFTLNLAIEENVQKFVTLEKDNYIGKWEFDQWFSEKSFMENVIFRLPMVYRLRIESDSGMYYNSPLYTELKDFPLPDENPALPNNGNIAVTTYGELNSKNNLTSYTISIGRRILCPLKPKGTLFIDIDSTSLYKLWENEDMNHGYITVVNKQGYIIYSPLSQQIGKKAEDFMKFEITSTPDSKIHYWSDNNEMYCSIVKKSKSTEWSIVATVPFSNISSPIITLRNLVVFICVISVPLSFIIIFIFVKRILTPLNRLEEHMKSFKDEQWLKIHGHIPNDEMGHLMLVYNDMVEKIQCLINQVYKVEIDKKQKLVDKQKAEFQALQMQINPHFLYNTLNTINMYAILSNEDKISQMVEALSDMFRYAVKDTLQPVMLKDEREHALHYLLIETHRQKLMPKIIWDIEDYLDFPVLRLTLQPIIENIFKHGFRDGINDEHFIHIKATEELNRFVFSIKDNGSGFPNAIHFASIEELNNDLTGIGLMNVYKRLKIAYGQEAKMLLSSKPGEGTCVQLILPFSNDYKVFDNPLHDPSLKN